MAAGTVGSMATGAVQQDLYCYRCDSRQSALPPHYIGENQDVRACPVCQSDFVELLDAAPPAPPQPPPGPIDGQDPLGGGFPAGPAQLLHMLFTRPDGSTVAFNELLGDAVVEGPGGLHFNMGANQGCGLLFWVANLEFYEVLAAVCSLNCKGASRTFTGRTLLQGFGGYVT